MPGLMRRCLALVLLTFCAWLHPDHALGQFSTTFDIPPDANIDHNGRVHDAQLNLFDNGSIGNDVWVLGVMEVNVFGGTVGDRFFARKGSVVNVFDGTVGSIHSEGVLRISGGSVTGLVSTDNGLLTISGGSIGSVSSGGGRVEITGGSIYRFFTLNGSEVSITGGTVLIHFAGQQ